jgi:hypothetical protein
MSHVFMYPRVSQIAPRAHSVPASWLGTRPLSSLQPALRPLASTGAGLPKGRRR